MKTIRMPMTTSGLRVGLLGGSFDPPHQGHTHISRWALRSFNLDQIWWLISPKNPLKKEGPAKLSRRMEAAKKLVTHPRIHITDIEAHIDTRYTADTLEYLLDRYPTVHFVWLMGADNLIDFHHWERWRWIMENVPIGVLARPGQQIRAGLSPAARIYAKYRVPAKSAKTLALKRPPAWSLLTGPMMPISSTEIRNNGDWVKHPST